MLKLALSQLDYHLFKAAEEERGRLVTAVMSTVGSTEAKE
jgi:hypothetical protein